MRIAAAKRPGAGVVAPGPVSMLVPAARGTGCGHGRLFAPNGPRREKKRHRGSGSDRQESVERDEAPRRRGSGSKPVADATASKEKGAAAKTDTSRRKEAKKAPKSSGKDGDDGSLKETPKSSGKQDSSDEYTYTSSPEDEKKKPQAAAKPAAKSAPKAGGTVPPAGPGAARHGPDRQLVMMNSLLKTAMETAAAQFPA